MRVNLKPKKIKSPIVYIASVRKLTIFLNELINKQDNHTNSTVRKDIELRYEDHKYESLSESELLAELEKNRSDVVAITFDYSNSTNKIHICACIGCGITVHVQSTIKGMATDYEEKIKDLFNQDSLNWVINNRKSIPVISFLATSLIYFELNLDKYIVPQLNAILPNKMFPTFLLTGGFYLAIFIIILMILYKVIEKFYKKIVIVDEYGFSRSRIFKNDLVFVKFFLKNK